MTENKNSGKTALTKILLIEDDPFMRDMIVLLLETENYEVTGVESGAEALKMLQQYNYGAIISDMYLPDTNGMNLYEKVHSLYSDPTFLILTSEMNEVIIKKATELGITYMIKDENFAETLLAALTKDNQAKPIDSSSAQLPAKLLHDLNQPLNSIKMTAGGILFLLNQGKKLPDEEIMECMKNISCQADLLAGIIKNLSSLIRYGNNPPINK
ncbi:response regulator [Sporomusa acidovorans]|uniref:histidine kinase n=1 Tax=Sporomusa acidovorans (strain ATCC 49682 / DSM 3132 / Mol) TaxID=1123286 RepID=A0ABZ3J8F3_SPOA4|nr:response regulator [Sporomusa acidovorans]OZC16678.1 putative transcriptional regulator [Sporomusa acidovorans DSM 3132]SDE06505.1 DNA-binding response regulator, OmpR family, contains REC and winged-helix (wHTH) domain [Sporomusa acidovorans]